MQGFLPGGERTPLPSVAEAQRRASRTAFNVVSTGSALQREGLTAVRTATHLSLNAVERTTGTDATGAHARVDDRFDAAQDASDRAEDRFLSVMLSTSQLTAEYARFVDDSFDRVCPVDEETDD
jgi:hypothetical protein